MKIIRKLLKNKTFLIIDGNHLEEIKDKLFKEYNEDPIWGYDDTYKEDNEVSSGFLHWDRGFYLSKDSLNKEILKNL